MKLCVSLSLCLAMFAVRLSGQCTFSTTDATKITETCATAGVGIGVAVPGADLHVKNSGSAEIRVEGGSTSADTGLRILGDRSWKLGSNISGSGAGKFTIFDVTGATSRFLIDPGAGVGVGPGFTTPWGGLHVRGAGQATTTPSLASGSPSQHGATLFLQDSGGGVNNGGMIAFGADVGHFAAIKGLQTDSTANTLGHLSFYTRNAAADTNLTERMRIWRDGRISVGSPGVATGRFLVTETNDFALAISAQTSTTVEQNGNQTDVGLSVGTKQIVNAGVSNIASVFGAMIVAENGGAGFVTQTIGSFAQSGISSTATGSVQNAYGAYVRVLSGQGTVTNGYGVYVESVAGSSAFGVYQASTSNKNYFAGNVGIGTTTPTTKLDVVGDIHASGSIAADGAIYAKYQDVAEWVPSIGDASPGTVVVIAAGLKNVVTPSAEGYDTRVAGVVSAQPGVILGERGTSKVTVATTGRVIVRCDATRAPIRAGDILVTSSTPGMAMRSEPVDVAGIKMHRPGTVIGKALEPLDSGTGEILVLLTLQ